MPLTLGLDYTAKILGTTATKLKAAVKKKKFPAIQLGGETRVSVFVLAKLLGTTPITLLNYLEDDIFGKMLEEADKEEGLSLEEARRRYATLFEEAKAA